MALVFSEGKKKPRDENPYHWEMLEHAWNNADRCAGKKKRGVRVSQRSAANGDSNSNDLEMRLSNLEAEIKPVRFDGQFCMAIRAEQEDALV